MSGRIQVKICGIKTSEALDAAVKGGAAFIGFVFHPASPRAVTLEIAASLRRDIPPGTSAVALVVDADDGLISDINRRVRPDLFQLHGAETLKRVTQIASLTGKPIIKACPIARSADVVDALAYEEVADWLMFDAKSAADGAASGGSGRSFDWKLLSGHRFRRPWLLAGGLNAGNAKAAAEASGARVLDVSSGVESSRGIKDPALIRAFLDTVRAL